MNWENEFRMRMARFKRGLPSQGNVKEFSIKIRVISGCYHREHSPHAYQIIDEYINSTHLADCEYIEHENGPELLVWVSLATVGVGLAASIINLVTATAIIKARSEGIKHGDRPSEPLELIVRDFDGNGTLREEKVLRIGSSQEVNESMVEQALLKATNKMTPKRKEQKGRPRKAASK